MALELNPISGEPVPIVKLLILSVLAKYPRTLRLVRIERDLWREVLEPKLQAPDEIRLPDDDVSPRSICRPA